MISSLQEFVNLSIKIILPHHLDHFSLCLASYGFSWLLWNWVWQNLWTEVLLTIIYISVVLNWRRNWPEIEKIYNKYLVDKNIYLIKLDKVCITISEGIQSQINVIILDLVVRFSSHNLVSVDQTSELSLSFILKLLNGKYSKSLLKMMHFMWHQPVVLVCSCSWNGETALRCSQLQLYIQLERCNGSQLPERSGRTGPWVCSGSCGSSHVKMLARGPQTRVSVARALLHHWMATWVQTWKN